MNQWASYLRAVLRHPPHRSAVKALRLGLRFGGEAVARRRDRRAPTYLDSAPKGSLRRRIRLGDRATSAEADAALARATAHYLAHRFDLLGSGWTQVRHGADCPGLEGHRFAPAPAVTADPEGLWLVGRVNAANLGESRRIWRLIGAPHAPIDWQLDFRSGYRWSERTHFRDLRYGRVLGADVKIPWELARMQHLPQLALAYRRAAAGAPGFLAPALYRDEMRSQTVDFIATNPPRFGVNWACAMDVAIRAVNVLIALDLFLDAGADFDSAFLDLVRRSVAEHGRHLVTNLEWAQTGRGNHYLADIVGLLFIAAYLPRAPETDAWFAFAAREFIAEADGQFLADGGYGESSTGYHRLGGELLAFGIALLLGVDEDELRIFERPHAKLAVRPPRPSARSPLHEVGGGLISPLPPALFETLAAAGRLSRDATKPTGEVVQWGDNDSGRLIKPQPAHERSDGRILEDALDHRGLVAAAAALTGQEGLGAWAGDRVEGQIARALARGRAVPVEERHVEAVPGPSTLDAILESIARLAPDSRRVVAIPLPAGAMAGVHIVAYPQFGHYALLGPRLFLAIRLPTRQFGDAPGHAHDDMLAVELHIDGCDVLTDPGTFVYTPLPAERNLYRAAAAHSVPRPAQGGGADLACGLFEMAAAPGGQCLFLGTRGIAGRAFGPDWVTIRVVSCESDHIDIVDACLTGPLERLSGAPNLPSVCRGYGAKTANPPRAR
ncbi:MAG: heparinase II/III family protein [Roseiarcus sp.]|jgi:heparinase II/III-like protein